MTFIFLFSTIFWFDQSRLLALAQDSCLKQPPCNTPAECLAIEVNLIAAMQLGRAQKTNMGVYFIRSEDYPDLGETWIDPYGVVWGDVATESNGQPLLMNHHDAVKYCQSKKASLPNLSHLVRLREQMGAKKMTNWSQFSELTIGYSPQVLPHFANKEGGDDTFSFWSADNRINPYVFNVSNGRIQATDQTHKSLRSVRCIRFMKW